MPPIISFRICGDYASFKDPYITTSQSVNLVPSKSAIVGILGAMIGIKRDHSFSILYSSEFINFFKNTAVGIQLNTKKPQKIGFSTNHRYLEHKTAPTAIRPFRTHLLEKPDYTIYVITSDDYFKLLQNALSKHNFVYSPYLGHAFCIAHIKDFKTINSEPISSNMQIKSVIFDDSENNEQKLSIEAASDRFDVVVEKHLHHYMNNDILEKKVIKYWIPINGTTCEIESSQNSTTSKFFTINDEEAVCLN